MLSYFCPIYFPSRNQERRDDQVESTVGGHVKCVCGTRPFFTLLKSVNFTVTVLFAFRNISFFCRQRIEFCLFFVGHQIFILIRRSSRRSSLPTSRRTKNYKTSWAIVSLRVSVLLPRETHRRGIRNNRQRDRSSHPNTRRVCCVTVHSDLWLVMWRQA